MCDGERFSASSSTLASLHFRAKVLEKKNERWQVMRYRKILTSLGSTLTIPYHTAKGF